jgi:hypothetical protein
MGRAFFYLIVAIMVGAIGFLMFPTIKSTFGFNSTDGFPDLLKALYTGLPYALAFFIFYAIYKAARGNKG